MLGQQGGFSRAGLNERRRILGQADVVGPAPIEGGLFLGDEDVLRTYALMDQRLGERFEVEEQAVTVAGSIERFGGRGREARGAD